MHFDYMFINHISICQIVDTVMQCSFPPCTEVIPESRLMLSESADVYDIVRKKNSRV